MDNINCPHCGEEINVEQEVAKGIKKDLDKEFKLKLKKEVSKNNADLRAKIEKEKQEETNVILEELASKNEKIKKLSGVQVQVEKLKRENLEIQEKTDLAAQKTINDTLAEERIKIAKTESDRSELRVNEKEHIINQLRNDLKTAQLKAEQASTQIQGEVQELAIEDWLKSAFPIDIISEIKKGANGADCMQTIVTQYKDNCGQIYYESKRTKKFQPAWISKLKADMLLKSASVGVLVTEALPEGMDRIGQMQGVWVCTFEDFKSLVVVLRDSLINVDNALMSQENKGDKMVMLYDYLTSVEFKLQVEGIIEGYVQMKTDLESEKRSMSGIWRKREKQIDKVILNTNFMHNSIKGIAGSAVQPIDLLQLPQGDV